MCARLLLTILLLLLACAPPPGGYDAGVRDAGDFQPDDCKRSPWDEAQVLVGEGQLSFHALVEDQRLTWEAGPQGGHHLWIALRLRGLRQTGTITQLLAVDEDTGETLSDRRLPFSFRREEGPWCALSGLRLQLDETGEVERLEGHHVRITATATDADGASSTGEARVVVGAPARDGG